MEDIKFYIQSLSIHSPIHIYSKAENGDPKFTYVAEGRKKETEPGKQSTLQPTEAINSLLSPQILRKGKGNIAGTGTNQSQLSRQPQTCLT